MKRKFWFYSLLISLSCTNWLSVDAQPYDSTLLKLYNKYPQEKLYLHFDRAGYNPGETIWFKAYLFDGLFPSDMSKTLYAELLDEQGKVMERKTAPFVLSGAAAAFDLPTDIKSSVVYVRAYTRWMLNFDTAFLYVKELPILGTKPINKGGTTPPDRKRDAKPLPNDIGTPNGFLQFFPEGGDLVEGIDSRVAFKATNRKGIPIKASGEILNSKGEKVASFASVHDGMGTFALTPVADELYHASWKDPSGAVQQTTLPRAKKSGVVMTINKVEKGIQYTIKRIPDPSAAMSVFVVAQMQQQLVYRAKASMTSSSMISGFIPTENLPAGITQLTIFTENHQPLAERLFFVNTQEYYFITDLNTAVKSVEKRGKNVIQIDVPDTVSCNLSISVTDASVDPINSGEENIYSRILLSGDIRGYVHNPGYYFNAEGDSVMRHLDLVMMTNGWRRFKWEEVLANKFPAIKHQPEEYLAIEGRVAGLTRSELQQKELTGIITLKNGNQQFITFPIQSDGSFQIADAVFYDTAKLFYQFNNDKDKVLSTRALVTVGNNLLTRPLNIIPDSGWLAVRIQPDSALVKKNREIAQKQLEIWDEERKKVKTMEAVVVKGRMRSRAEVMNDEYASGFFKGGDGATFIVEDDPLAQASLSVLNYLQGKVAGLMISVQGATDAQLSWRGGSPALYINEMQSDVQMIQSMPMTDVAMIKVYRPPFFGSFGGGAGGAIAVYTKKGKSSNERIKGLDFANIQGYSAERQFYSPDYTKFDETQSQPDLRNTLYWNPFVFTNKQNRRIFLSFFNNDTSKKFRVVVEGINTDGRMTRIEKIFE